MAVGCKRLLGGESGRGIEGATQAAKAVLADALRPKLDARAELPPNSFGSLDGSPDSDAETDR